MLFGPGARFSSLFATHPLLLDRIKVLDALRSAELERSSRQWAARPPSGMAEDLALGLVGRRTGRDGRPNRPHPHSAAPRLRCARPKRRYRPTPGTWFRGSPSSPTTRSSRAESLISQIPEPILARARDAQMAVLVLGLLLAEQPEAVPSSTLN